jgi:hypothetical protein
MHIHGIIPPVATPMQANEDLDLLRPRWFIDRLIAGSVHGIFVLGTNSEFYAPDEREKQTAPGDGSPSGVNPGRALGPAGSFVSLLTETGQVRFSSGDESAPRITTAGGLCGQGGGLVSLGRYRNHSRRRPPAAPGIGADSGRRRPAAARAWGKVGHGEAERLPEDFPTKGVAMTANRLALGALLAAVLAAAPARAQCYYPPIPQAPDACGPGYYCTGPCGMTYGPGYCLRPGFEPFQGAILGPPAGGPGGLGGPGGPGGLGSPLFPTHPYARGPRDYFMIYERSPRPYF